MKGLDNHRRAWPLIGLCCALVFTLGSGMAEAKNDKGGGKCEGTKKQRKQKMEKREISDEEFEEMIEQYKQEVSAELEGMKQTVIRRLERKLEASRTTGEPFVYDILIVSGGGAKGAFGAGFFEGWGEIESGAYARPEFDMVTGVSTGALLAPFAYLGTDDAYSAAAEFYAHPAPNWVTKRGAIQFLPSHISMFNTCHLQDTVRSAIDPPMIEALAEVAAEDRLLLIGATNLDIGVGRAFNLGQAARHELENPGHDRVAQILLASSAIPGAFPPLEIDGMLYGDGGATSNLFIATFPGPGGAMAGFQANKPEAPLPKVRVWIVVNQQLKPQHHVTQPKWIEISGRALDALTSTGQLFALAIIRDMVHVAKAERGIDAELHLVSIPDDAPEQTTKEMFDQDYMRALQSLGRKMGADPSSWTNAIPSAYRVSEKWLESR
jgi:predicted acylesterase/phospholipase RssA